MATALDAIPQAAAIPVKAGRICLVTSRSGKRWVIPKGCLEHSKTVGEIALQEAWEEAGIQGVLQPEALGHYFYEKWDRTYCVTVFLMEVTRVSPNWPEADRRQRCWLRAAKAVERIEEPGLRKYPSRHRGILKPPSQRPHIVQGEELLDHARLDAQGHGPQHPGQKPSLPGVPTRPHRRWPGL